jgi:hypothetical protein
MPVPPTRLLPNTNLALGPCVQFGQIGNVERLILNLTHRQFTEAWLLWLASPETNIGATHFLVDSSMGAAQTSVLLAAGAGQILTAGNWYRHPVPTWHERITLDVAGDSLGNGLPINWQLFPLENTIRPDWRP